MVIEGVDRKPDGILARECAQGELICSVGVSYRLRLVTHARQHGIKAAARAFQTIVPTVQKWLRRYQAQGLKGLQELSRTPRSCPHKIRGELDNRSVNK